MATIFYLIIGVCIAWMLYNSIWGQKQEPDAQQSKPQESPISVVSQSNPDAPVQKLKYFCIKDKGYHISVWPNDVSQFDIVEFNIAGMSHRDNIDDHLGEFKGSLESEPTNAYDPNAIKVLANDGHHVGYVPKDMTDEIRDNATLPCQCFCYIGENDGVYFSDCYILRPNVSPK